MGRFMAGKGGVLLVGKGKGYEKSGRFWVGIWGWLWWEKGKGYGWEKGEGYDG